VPERFSVDVDGGKTTAIAYASKTRGPVLVLAHGAGAPQSHPFMVEMATDLAARGVEVVTFNFLYSEKKKRGAPDKPALLEACWRAVLRDVRERAHGRALLIGGKSMGGRIASMIAPGEADLTGLVLLGYPLHPPGKPQQLRVAHLPDVKAPMLFVQGARDAFGTPDELRPVVSELHGTELFVVEGGDHSFKVPKSANVAQKDVMTRVKDHVAAWVRARAE
jgi:predicted alpha/beta-hydrolase family hydrolase